MSFFDQVEDFEDLFPDPYKGSTERVYRELVTNGTSGKVILGFDPGYPTGVHEMVMEPGKTYTILDEYVAHTNAYDMRRTIYDYFRRGLLSDAEFRAGMERINMNNFQGMTRKEVIEHEIARLQKEHAELSQFGEDEFDAYTILRISMQYDHEKPNATTYRYAAIKIGNVWYTTATTNRGNQFMWADLVMWMKPHVVKIEIMNTNTVLFDKDAKIIEAPSFVQDDSIRDDRGQTVEAKETHYVRDSDEQ